MTLSQHKRPTGVTVLGYFSVIGGIIVLALGTAMAALGMTFPLMREEVISANELVTGIPRELMVTLVAMVGSILIGLGALSLVLGIGLMKGKKWAWTLAVISGFISVAVGAIYIIGDAASGIATIILEAIILYYLYRPHVKEYFGKTNTLKPSTT